MYYELKENKVHGTKEFPYMDYHVNGIQGAFQIPVHWHNELEIVYVLSGPFQIIIEGEEYSAKKGDIFIVNPGELHLMASNESGADYHTFVFPLELVSFQSEDQLSHDFFTPLRMGTLRFHNRVPDFLNMSEAREILAKLIPAYRRDSPTRQLEIRILLLQFFQTVFHEEAFNRIGEEKSSLGRDLLTLIQQTYSENISLSQLASTLHLSEKYISRYFKQSFHINLTEYIRHLRITKAKHLLSSTDLPVTEIAYLSGFQDVSYFVRTFHKDVGMSPLQYRKAL